MLDARRAGGPPHDTTRRRDRPRVSPGEQARGGGACGRSLALGLDDDRDLGGHALEDADRDLVRAERLERLLEVDLVLVDRDAATPERVGDVLRGERAVELAALADLHAHRQRRARDAGGCDLSVGAFTLPLLFAAGD